MNRLAQMLLESDRERAPLILVASEAAHGNRRHPAAEIGRQRANAADERETILLRHADVRYDDVGRALAEALHRLLRRRNGTHARTGEPHDLAERLARILLILDE